MFENEDTQSFPKCIPLQQQQGKRCAINCNSGNCNRLVMVLARNSGCVLELKGESSTFYFCSVRVNYQLAFSSYLIKTAKVAIDNAMQI